MSRQVDVKALVSHIVRGDGADKCRICMGDTSEGQVYLGDTVMKDGDKPVTLAELLEIITGVEVESSAQLPQKVCSRCFANLTDALPFFVLSRQSARLWQNITDHLHDSPPPDNTMNLYFVMDGEELYTVADSVNSRIPKATNKTQALRNFKTRLNRVRAYKKRSHKETRETKAIQSGLQCPECDTTFNEVTQLNIHIKYLGIRRCYHCREVMEIKNVKEHLRTGHNIESFSCEICSDTYEKESGLIRHMNRNHRRGSAFCVYCKMSFPNQQSLVSHSRMHKTHICTGCERKFAKTCFKRHIENCFNAQTRPSLFICDYCKKEYKLKNALKCHIVNVHLVGPKFQCHECGKKFLHRIALEEHDNSHNRIEDRYVCSVCGNKYSSRNGYHRHCKRHLDDGSFAPDLRPKKTYACTLCERTFSRKRYLTEHQKTHPFIPFGPSASDISSTAVDSGYKIQYKGVKNIIFI